MSTISGHGLEKAYGDRAVLAGVDLTIEDGERVGLVGSNGSGKTTLARIIAGVEHADGGEIRLRREARVGYLEQDPSMEPQANAIDIVLGGLGDYLEALEAHHNAGLALESSPASERKAWLAKQASAGEAVERLGGWDMRHRASKVLGHLGIDDVEREVGTMSGGEKRRIALARILVGEPDLAILDEPTNHLDIATIEWLENYLVSRYRGAVLLITHDRYLLDRVVKRTLEVDGGAVYSYEGAWQEYLEARALRAAHEKRAEANRQNFLRRELEWLRRQPKARTTKSKARVDRAEAALNQQGPKTDTAALISAREVRSGKTIIEARELSIELGGRTLVKDFEMTLTAGQRIGIIGANGAGKTTLLRVLLGKLAPTSGTVKTGSNVRVAYLDQTRAGLEEEKTIFENVAQGSSHVRLGDREIEMRSYLYRFLFGNLAQKQLVKTLSGGERARVSLAKVLREQANLVVLDEPTNDLDATTLSSLEESLLEFGGTSLVVTHDRWFLDRVATHLISFEGDGEVIFHSGNFSDYSAWEKARRGRDAPAARVARTETKAKKAASPATKKLTYGEQIELDGLMEKIEAAEAGVARLEAPTLASEFSGLPYQDQAAALTALEAARKESDSLVERWSDLESRSQD